MAKIYISGPMTGHKEFNFPAFDRAKKRLLKAGYDAVISPADERRRDGFNEKGRTGNESFNEIGLCRERVIMDDLNAVMQCHVIYLLKGWEDSQGALAELAVAKWAGKVVLMERPGSPDD